MKHTKLQLHISIYIYIKKQKTQQTTLTTKKTIKQQHKQYQK